MCGFIVASLSVCVFSLTLHATSWSVQPLLSNQFFFFFLHLCVKVPNPKTHKSWEVLSDSETAPVKLPLLSWVTCIAANVVLGHRNTDRTHMRIYPRHLRLVQRYNQKMTARTWCSLWKPSIHRGTELLKYQTQRWIPLQTCSLFFTVGLNWCNDPLVADITITFCLCCTHTVVYRFTALFHCLLFFRIALVVR